MAKVTKALHDTWAQQLAQFIEEREFTQDGRPRSMESLSEIDQDIALMGRLLALPIGAEIPPR